MEIQPGTENELINNMVYINATTYTVFSRLNDGSRVD